MYQNHTRCRLGADFCSAVIPVRSLPIFSMSCCSDIFLMLQFISRSDPLPASIFCGSFFKNQGLQPVWLVLQNSEKDCPSKISRRDGSFRTNHGLAVDGPGKYFKSENFQAESYYFILKFNYNLPPWALRKSSNSVMLMKYFGSFEAAVLRVLINTLFSLSWYSASSLKILVSTEPSMKIKAGVEENEWCYE